METKPDKWKLERQVGRDMHDYIFNEAICEHRIGHHKGVHGCDGCCANWPKDVSDFVSED